MRGLAAGCIASQALSMSFLVVRAKPQITGPSGVPTSLAIRFTAAKSSGEAAGKPASMMSTPNRASCRAMSIFSALVMLQPGDCSPSRRVVSKI